MGKSAEQSSVSSGTLSRGIHGTLSRVFTGILYCGITGTVCADSPVNETVCFL